MYSPRLATQVWMIFAYSLQVSGIANYWHSDLYQGKNLKIPYGYMKYLILLLIFFFV